jgi:hypothetical protein
VVWRTSLKHPGTIQPPDHGFKGASCGWATKGCWIGQDPPRRSNEPANQAHYCDGSTPHQVPNTQGMRDVILVCLLQRREKVPRAWLRCGWALFDRIDTTLDHITVVQSSSEVHSKSKDKSLRLKNNSRSTMT